ncbi:MAG: glycosyltransferase family 4 protein [Acidobacteriia bacterium]|nr:glycosyltransferase family 4 protein [Terriglobia bacterium]
MNTLHVDLGKQWRGGQSQALLLIQGLLARGHSAELLTRRESPLAQRAHRLGIKVHSVPGPAARLRAALRLRKLLAEGKFDILHLHDAHAVTPAWLARAERFTSVVASRRVAYPLQTELFALARYQTAHRILAVSEFVAKSVVASGMPRERVQVVYDGVELKPLPAPEIRRSARDRWGITDDEMLLGCVGYLLPEKGQEFLIRALPAVRARFPRCRLLLAGIGPQRGRFERLVREMGIESAVIFTGFVEDVAQVYSALDVFVFPSLAEPLGSSLLAAMAFALPIVAVARGAVPEVIEDGATGLLVPDPDPQQIAAAILRLLVDTKWAARLGVAARAAVQDRFSADHMVEQTLQVYQQVRCRAGRSLP